MKKGIVILLMVALCAFSAFAIDMSTGGGIDFTHFWSADKTKTGDFWTKNGMKANLLGFNAFFDAQYVRAGLGVNFSVGGLKSYSKDSNGTKSDNIDKDISGTYVNLLVLGKYPFGLGIAKIYPMAGFEFAFNVATKAYGLNVRENMSDDMKKKLNHYFFVAGLGADIDITDSIYLTPTMLFGIDLKKASDYETTKKGVEAMGGKYHSNNFMFNLGFGVGYKF